MTTFNQVWNSVIAELTPQPWEYTDAAGVTLTIIPEGLTQYRGDAVVVIGITASHNLAAEAGITTSDMPGLIAALAAGTEWSHETSLRDSLTLAFDEGGAVNLTVAEFDWSTAGREETPVVVHLPAAERMPLVSALRRANDVALGWEEDVDEGN